MSGYNFKLHRWSEPFWVNFGERDAHLEQKHFEHIFTIPDGMWVMRQLYIHRFESKLLGHAEALNLGRQHLGGWDDTLLFSPVPFVSIHVVYGDDPSEGAHGAYLHRARQIHKGELGQFVPVELPLVAREAAPERPWTNRDRRRGDGWVRLTDAAEMAGLSIEELVLDHWLFVEARSYPDAWTDVKIEMIRAQYREQIHKQVVSRHRRVAFSKDQIKAMASNENTIWDELWIRRGFARTVLLLQKYGWNKSRERLLLNEFRAA